LRLSALHGESETAPDLDNGLRMGTTLGHLNPSAATITGKLLAGDSDVIANVGIGGAIVAPIETDDASALTGVNAARGLGALHAHDISLFL